MLDNMLFFHYFPSMWCCIMRYRRSHWRLPLFMSTYKRFASQINKKLGQWFLPRFMVFIVSWNALIMFTFKYPSDKFESQIRCLSSMIVPNWHHSLHWQVLVKFILYKLSSYRSIAVDSPCGPHIIHSFRLNCTSNPFDKNLLTESKFACNLDTWRAFLI